MNHHVGTAMPNESVIKEIKVRTREEERQEKHTAMSLWHFMKVQLLIAVPGIPNLCNLWHHIKTICRDGTCLHNSHSLVSHPDSIRV